MSLEEIFLHLTTADAAAEPPAASHDVNTTFTERT